MGHPATAREALIAEVIGDVTGLLDRIESLKLTIDQASHTLLASAATVTSTADNCSAQMSAVSQNVRVKAVEYIAARTQALAQQSLLRQSEAMTQAAREIVARELAPELQRLATSLVRAVEQMHRPWDDWLTHAATAAASAAVAAVLVLCFVRG